MASRRWNIFQEARPAPEVVMVDVSAWMPYVVSNAVMFPAMALVVPLPPKTVAMADTIAGADNPPNLIIDEG